MELVILNETKDSLEFELRGENHTLCNALREALWMIDDTLLASYRIQHPLIGNPHFIVKTKSGKHRKAVQDALILLKKRNKEVRTLFNSL